ncbi:MAG: hypothetical protein PSX71_13625 [bacterium]|nr:hypothetical protein [bacterium]
MFQPPGGPLNDQSRAPASFSLQAMVRLRGIACGFYELPVPCSPTTLLTFRFSLRCLVMGAIKDAATRLVVIARQLPAGLTSDHVKKWN